MPPAITESEFNDQLRKHGFRLISPGDPDFVVWGYVDIGDGVVVDRWRGGSTLASQLAHLVSVKEASKSLRASGPPPATHAEPVAEKRKAKAKKRAAKGA
jgi:hypothetical protein